MLNFFKYILIQDIEIDKDHKTFQVFNALLGLAISTFLSFGLFYLLKDYLKSNIFLYILWLYLSVAFFSSGPCAAIDQKKDVTDPMAWILNFGFYNGLGIFVAPLYLMKYSLKKSK